MKTILAYGDSLTWGSVPGAGLRHPQGSRWPDALAEGLGSGVDVITDGLRGRLTAYDDHTAGCDRNGSRTLPTALYAHAPLDLVIILLGINDLQPHIAGSSLAAMDGLRRLVTIIQTHESGPDYPAPKVLIISPPHLCETDDQIYAEYFLNMIDQSRDLAVKFEQISKEKSCAFFDAANVCKASPVDGVHMDEENTINLGKALVPVVKGLLN
ncbi:MAG: SGNH/GDSL hydrolase family protein [Pseudomonadota bacterium]